MDMFFLLASVVTTTWSVIATYSYFDLRHSTDQKIADLEEMLTDAWKINRLRNGRKTENVL